MGTPTAAPAMEPRLQPAWKRGMIARPRARSTSAPSTFMATSQTPTPTPYTKKPAAVTGTDVRPAIPTEATTRPTVANPAPSRTTAAALVRSISQPLDGSASTEPAAIASSSSPSAPLDRESSARTSGTRDTRLAKQRPLRTKAVATAFRAAVRRGTGPVHPMGAPASKSAPSRGQARRATLTSPNDH